MNSEWQRWCQDMQRVVEGLVKEVDQIEQEQIVENYRSASPYGRGE